MFNRHHRKARLFFGLSDIILTALAFEAAYQDSTLATHPEEFILTVPLKALLSGPPSLHGFCWGIGWNYMIVSTLLIPLS